jgi:hypothetical protein
MRMAECPVFLLRSIQADQDFLTEEFVSESKLATADA